jgi:hypothetical protein
VENASFAMTNYAPVARMRIHLEINGKKSPRSPSTKAGVSPFSLTAASGLRSFIHDAGLVGAVLVFFFDQPAVAHLDVVAGPVPRGQTLKGAILGTARFRQFRLMPSSYDGRSDKVLARQGSAP